MASEKLLEKMPPQNQEAEMAVLASMLLDREAISSSIEYIKEDAFYSEANRNIFKSIIKLYDANEGVDLVTLVEDLKKRDLLDSVGGPAYITELINGVPTSANIEHYAKIVREKYLLRRLINTATKIVSDSYTSSTGVEEILDKAEQLIFGITTDKENSKNMAPIREIVKTSIEAIDLSYQRKEHVTGVATGLHELDIMTAGLQKADLIVLAARPSMGKSALACSILEYASVVEKVPCAFFSLEMSKESLVQRMLCSIAKVNAHKVRTGFLSQSDWPKLVEAAQKLSEAPIYIDDTPSLSALELRAKARRMKAKHDIKLMVVDYLQLMRGSSKESRQQEISEISRSLKALARELGIPIISISQLSRAAEQREDHRPRLSDLRESGAIEQDADLVLLLFREEYYDPTEENKGVGEIIVGKQRNGPTGVVKIAFLSEYTKFCNLSRAEEEEGF